MKKIFAVILSCVMVLSFTACETDKITDEATETTAHYNTVKLTINDEKLAKIEKKLSNVKGIAYVTHNGELIYSHAKGNDECGNALTVDAPMYIGSVSKQFCAAAVLILKEQGKLSVDDTLYEYFPKYSYAKNITIKNLLTMRSGIPDVSQEFADTLDNKSDAECTDILMKWFYEQPLNFEPDSKFEYSNTNYYLLSQIVEKVSNQKYNDFVRENIFQPLEMHNSGFINEVEDNESFSGSLTFNTFHYNEDQIASGAGDIVSTAPDIDKWMTSLMDGKILSDASYREMCENYSPDTGTRYGYGIEGMYMKGNGHTGNIGDYYAINYFNENYNLNIFAADWGEKNEKLLNVPDIVMEILIS